MVNCYVAIPEADDKKKDEDGNKIDSAVEDRDAANMNADPIFFGE